MFIRCGLGEFLELSPLGSFDAGYVAASLRSVEEHPVSTILFEVRLGVDDGDPSLASCGEEAANVGWEGGEMRMCFVWSPEVFLDVDEDEGEVLRFQGLASLWLGFGGAFEACM